MGNVLVPHLASLNQPDVNWLVQGRVIPASVTGTEPALYIQARHITWSATHFHVGHCPIPANLAVEIAMTICVPFHPRLLAKSYTFEEQTRGLFYTHMARMLEPSSTIAFITVTGLIALIKLDNIDAIFRYDNECQECIGQGNKSIPDDIMDKMLAITGGKYERSH